MRKYPVSIQSFEKLRTENYYYVDKTALVYKMTHDFGDYVFLSRPRRFGKSLLTSTLKCYFEGQRELFKGLAIDELEQEWTHYPVLQFDMSTAKHFDAESLRNDINFKLGCYEKIWGRDDKATDDNIRLQSLIERAHEQSGHKVVILIDEYDAPLLDVMTDESRMKEMRQIIRNFYSPLKNCDAHLRFVFLTGITKFSQLSIFSELNNLKKISLDPQFATICGISEEELTTQLSEGLAALAEAKGMTQDEALASLKARYDGYHFSSSSPDVYNPFSLINALADRNLQSYWFESGTPTFLIEMLQKYALSPSQLSMPVEAQASEFDAPTENMTSIYPLLYQSGYLTIKAYDPISENYTLGIPNREVRTGLYRNLLTHYAGQATRTGNTTVGDMYAAIRNDDMGRALELLKVYLQTVPQTSNTDYEGHYQQLLFVIFSLLGYYVDVEVRTSKGRVDMVLRSATKLYLVELKLNRSAAAALKQIDLCEYDKRFALCGLPIVKVGINFSVKKKTLTSWKIED